LPVYKAKISKIDLHKKFGIPDENRIILYQGVLSEGRGIELILNALKILPNYAFVILGEGAFKEKFIGLSKKLNLSNRVHFSGMIPQDKLLDYTAGADLGIALIENISKSYFYALPNKLFEYIMAGIPVIVSDLPQMKNIIETYDVGKIVIDLQPKNIADTIDGFLQDKSEVEKIKKNCNAAAKNLNWEKEFNLVFPKLFNKHSFEND
jgi:glycosyltransferase involved in cell wall biosynthesis